MIHGSPLAGQPRRSLCFPVASDKHSQVTRFLEDAQSLLDAARAAERGTTAILVTSAGRRIIPDALGPLDSLALHHRARTAYLVTRGLTRITVEGREAGHTVRLEASTHSNVPISNRSRTYHIVPINAV